MSRITRLTANTALGLLCVLPSAAWAQTADNAAGPNQERAASSQDIVVTARRREEAITDVPIAVQAFGGEQLTSRGIDRIDDLQRATPSLGFRPTAGRRSNSQYEIRGITATESLITGDAAVGVYVNEVYRARATGTNQSFYDIDNVQVLYGPQGTLFGRNSSAGAVLINTKRPTDNFEGEISAGIGNFDRQELTAMINIPVSDSLAVRFAGQRMKRDGYGVNVTTGRRIANNNTWSGRMSVLFKPTDRIENLLIGSIYHANEKGSLVYLNGFRPCPASGTGPAASCSTLLVPGTTQTIGQAVAATWARRQTLGAYETELDAGFRDFRSGSLALSLDPLERSRNYSISNATTFELTDDITLKNIFGYNKVKLIAANDLDGTPLKLVDTYYDSRVSQISNELQLQGETGGLTWVVGGMYFRERGVDIQNSIQLIYTDTRQNLVGINKSYAVFAQGTYKLTDQLSLTAGGRYTWDKRYAEYRNPRTISTNSTTGVVTDSCSIQAIVGAGNPCHFEDSVSFKQPTYTVSLDYKPSRDTLFYIAHRLGYRSGGLQARVAPTSFGVVPPFGPEKVRDIEFGFKGDFDLNGVGVNTSLALYKAWYTGIQRQITIFTGLSPTSTPPGPVTTTALRNVGKAEVKGLEAELGITPVKGFNIQGFFGYVDGVYTEFENRGVIVPDVPFTTSKYSAGVTMSLTPIDDIDIGTVTFSGNYSYKSSFTTDQSLPIIEPESTSPPQHNVNLSLLWENVGGSNLSAQLWARNITNEFQPLGFTALASSFGVAPGVLGEPRTYGLTLKYAFGK
ncbi:iron complex outermembrane recepter protein [Sphingobium faniae]|nr:iron complex outermembrane recepter protein [Sphingobium faniae]